MNVLLSCARRLRAVTEAALRDSFARLSRRSTDAIRRGNHGIQLQLANKVEGGTGEGIGMTKPFRTSKTPSMLAFVSTIAASTAIACAQTPATDDVEPAVTLTFDRAVLLEPEGATSANVSIGDLDQDGHLDVVLVKGRHWPLSDILLMGDGTGAFRPARAIASVEDRSYSGVLVDIDADGDLDVVVSNDHPDPNLVYLNNGQGEFTVGSHFGKGEWPTRHVNVTDLNNDGQPDIIIANRTGDSSGFNYVCLNRGAGQFDDDCIAFSQESSTTITALDFNDDGLPDLAVPHREGGQSHIYLNGGMGEFPERIAFGPPDAAIRKAEAADLNGDGLLDLVAIDERKGAAIHFRRLDGSFDAAQPLGEAGPTPYALALADLNEDGYVDVIVGHVEARPVAYFNSGRGMFSAVPFGDEQGVAYGFATGDIDEDGVTDIAMARSDAPNVLYFGSGVPEITR